MAMDAIYPKKLVPFNTNTNRGVVEKNISISMQNQTPGKLYKIDLGWFFFVEIIFLTVNSNHVLFSFSLEGPESTKLNQISILTSTGEKWMIEVLI